MTDITTKRSMIWVLGEALIDFVPVMVEGAVAYTPQPGGSPYNAAKAAALAGADVCFAGAISNDFFGDMLVADLHGHKVDTTRAQRSDAPSTLAFVTFVDDQPRYAFFNNLSSTALIDPSPFAAELRPQDVLLVGSISLIDLPGADNIAREALECAPGALLAFDPNVRASMVCDWPDWTGRMNRLMEAAGLIKLSIEDLGVLRPNMSNEVFAAERIAAGAALIVITDGENGAEAFSSQGRVVAHAPKIAVKDTVGAGDTLMGALLAELCHFGATQSQTLRALSLETLNQVLYRAVCAAALNCTEHGCKPPARQTVDAWLKGNRS